MYLRTCTGMLILALLAGCGGDRPGPQSSSGPALRQAQGAPRGASGSSVPLVGGAATGDAEWFSERAAASGLDFVHFNGMSGELYYPEMFGPGVGLIDVDNDGDLDVYVIQGQMLGKGKTVADALFPPPSPKASAGLDVARKSGVGPHGPLRDRLFRNDFVVRPPSPKASAGLDVARKRGVGPDGTRTLHFTDITAQSGIDIRSYGMGVAAGDIDNDGWIDIYRTGLDRGVMLRNNGNGTFGDVTATSGTANLGGWGVSASFLDYDRDDHLDLYVGNYVEYSLERNVDCLNLTGRPDYCPPAKYPAQRDRLYRNRGNGTFEDVTKRALVGGAGGPALGVSTADFDGDGWIDIYVANDGEPNQLWMNQRDGTFKDTAFLSGAAVNAAGRSEASMGIDAGDFDNDGDEDLFITNWLSEMNTLYVNAGRGVFEDRKAASGLGPPSLAKTGFGTAWLDFDNDGWLDLLTVNGGVAVIEAQARAGDRFPFRMSNQLYRNDGHGRFEDVSARAGGAFTLAEVGRGAAFGDIDNDGDVDVVIGNAAAPVRLLVNNIGNLQHWIGLRLVGGAAGRDMLGARVAIVRKDGSTVWRRVRSDGSYASANDPRVLVGLGAATGPAGVRVQWPDGRMEEWSEVVIDRWTTLKQGTGGSGRAGESDGASDRSGK